MGHQELVVILACMYLVKSKDQGREDVRLLFPCSKASDDSFTFPFPFLLPPLFQEAILQKHAS